MGHFEGCGTLEGGCLRVGELLGTGEHLLEKGSFSLESCSLGGAQREAERRTAAQACCRPTSHGHFDVVQPRAAGQGRKGFGQLVCLGTKATLSGRFQPESSVQRSECKTQIRS